MSDLIEREAAIDALVNKGQASTRYKLSESWELNSQEIREALNAVPPAQPEQKTGYFIGTEFDGYADGSPVYYEWECSECGCVFEDDEPTYNYCPYCGAKMIEK